MERNPDKEKRLNQNILLIAVGFLLMSAGPALAWEPWSYSAEPIDGRVLDKETGQPVEGAVVVAQWILMGNFFHPDKVGGNLMVLEAITDADGRYHISGWGPKSRPWFTWLEDDDPSFVVFKSGYWPNFEANKDPAWGCIICNFNKRGSKLRKAYWNGKDIHLVPFRIGQTIEKKKLYEPTYVSPEDEKTPIEMTKEKWAEQIENIQDQVSWGRWWGKHDPWTKDDWLKIKNLVQHINEECRKLLPLMHSNIRHLPDEYKNLILGDTPSCL